jgi:hypothetical protein
MLRNGFMGRFIPLLGEGSNKPRRATKAGVTTPKKLAARLERLGRAKVAFSHSNKTAILANEVTQSTKGLDSWLTARAEEHVLQVADILVLDRQFRKSTSTHVKIKVTEADVLQAREFVVQALTGLQSLVKTTRIPPGGLLSLYHMIHNLHLEHSMTFTKAQVFKTLLGFKATEIESAINTAQEARFIRAKYSERRGIVYRVLEDPLRIAG